MSWVPAFKLGLWNAWILMLFFPFQSLIMKSVDKLVGTGGIYKKMGGEAPQQRGEKNAYLLYLVIILVLMAYSIFLPLRLGTLWFYAGIIIYLAGLVIFLTALVNVSTTPLGQLFTRGMYRFSRHPLYLSSLLILVGVSLASASWVFLLLTGVIIIVQAYQVAMEEKGCLVTYGAEYQKYMDRTSKWIGIPRSK